MLEAVRNEVADNPPEHRFVGHNHARRVGNLHDDVDGPCAQLLLEAEQTPSGYLGHVDRRQAEGEIASVEASQVEEVVGEAREFRCLHRDDVEVPLWVLAYPPLERVDVPGYRRDGRTKVVREIADELTVRLLAAQPVGSGRLHRLGEAVDCQSQLGCFARPRHNDAVEEVAAGEFVEAFGHPLQFRLSTPAHHGVDDCCRGSGEDETDNECRGGNHFAASALKR